jgi:hypothetical protein
MPLRRCHLREQFRRAQAIIVTAFSGALDAKVGGVLFHVPVVRDDVQATARAVAFVNRPHQRQHVRHRRSISRLIYGHALILLLLASPVRAEDQPAAWSQGKKLADWTSTGLVGAQIVADGWTSRHDLGSFACRIGLTVGAAELVKHTVSRTRPDGSDRMSFYSEHTALATVSSGWKFQIGIPVAIGAGYLRMGAGKHFASDVAVGAVAGLLAQKVCQ